MFHKRFFNIDIISKLHKYRIVTNEEKGIKKTI